MYNLIKYRQIDRQIGRDRQTDIELERDNATNSWRERAREKDRVSEKD